MLWYKSWLESRTRFIVTAAVIVGFCAFAVFFSHATGGQYNAHIYDVIYAGEAKGVFAMLSIFLGLGGLLRERAHRSAVFTLALPVSRSRILGAQVGIGVLQLAALSLLPALLLPVFSLVHRQSYPVAQALHFSVLWFVCGSIIFATAFLLSVSLAGEYTALVVCYVLLMVHTVIATWRLLLPYRLNLMWTMGEFNTMHWNSGHKLLLSLPMPWARLFTITAIALTMLLFAKTVAESQDF